MHPACEYLVKGEPGQPQVRCGSPSTHGRNTGGGVFHYCETHAREAVNAADRMKQRVNIFKLVGHD
jgi:hypothetical protein